MSNGNGRKAQIRQYAEDNGVAYTEALREFERVDSLFDRFKAEWVKFTDFPIRLDHLDVLVSVTPDVQEPFPVDWDAVEKSDGFRSAAFDMALEALPNLLHDLELEPYDWAANAAPFNPDDDDEEPREYRIGSRVMFAYRRLFGDEISATDQRDGTTEVVFWDEELTPDVFMPSPDWQDVERRRAYEEVAQQIHQLALDGGVFDDAGAEDDEVEWTPIDYSDPDWAFKVTPEQFLAEQRYRCAAGHLEPKHINNLDSYHPGWYDSWLNADPLSTNGYRRRLAICAGTVPDTIQVLNHQEDAVMEFKLLATGERLTVELTGTDEQMREQARSSPSRVILRGGQDLSLGSGRRVSAPSDAVRSPAGITARA